MDDDDWTDDFLKKIEHHIEHDGRAVISIMGTPGHPEEYPFAYSVGHAEKGNPELMLTSLGGDTATYLVNAAAGMLKKIGWSAPDGGTVWLERVQIRFISAPGFEQEARVARRRAEDKDTEIRFIQVLWPDEKGRFPDEEDYDHVNFPQPIWKHEQEKATTGIN